MLLHCSLALEILQDVHNPDVILVPCGGGALLAGVAAAVKIAGHTRCRVYGIEPQGGKYHMRKMYVVIWPSHRIFAKNFQKMVTESES